MKVLVVLGGTVSVLLLGLLAVVTWYRWDAERTALRNRDRCGIGQRAFAEPSSVSVTGWQDTTYTYGFNDLPPAWIDTHVLSRFEGTGPVSELPLLREMPMTDRQPPPRTSGAGNHLVWSSPLSESAKGFTTFDVYRSTDGDTYELIVACSSR